MTVQICLSMSSLWPFFLLRPIIFYTENKQLHPPTLRIKIAEYGVVVVQDVVQTQNTVLLWFKMWYKHRIQCCCGSICGTNTEYSVVVV